jgi:hypothetical protein
MKQIKPSPSSSKANAHYCFKKWGRRRIKRKILQELAQLNSYAAKRYITILNKLNAIMKHQPLFTLCILHLERKK